MAERPNPYPLRIDQAIMDKIKYISKENGRSINKEIEFRLKKSVSEYEKQYGTIPLSDPCESE